MPFPERDGAVGEMERKLWRGVVDGIEMLPHQPELVEEDGGIVVILRFIENHICMFERVNERERERERERESR